MTPAPGEGDVTRVQRPPRRGGSAARRPDGPVGRVRAAWRELFSEQRLAGIAALGLIGSMFLPWYQQTGFLVQRSGTAEGRGLADRLPVVGLRRGLDPARRARGAAAAVPARRAPRVPPAVRRRPRDRRGRRLGDVPRLLPAGGQAGRERQRHAEDDDRRELGHLRRVPLRRAADVRGLADARPPPARAARRRRRPAHDRARGRPDVGRLRRGDHHRLAPTSARPPRSRPTSARRGHCGAGSRRTRRGAATGSSRASSASTTRTTRNGWTRSRGTSPRPTPATAPPPTPRR